MSLIPHSRPSISRADVAAVTRTVASSQLAEGREVAAFEKEFAKKMGVKYAVAVSSGTAALHLSLLSLKVRRGDEVILPSYVCTALLNAVNYTGARPVLADVDYGDGNISILSVTKKLTAKTKAIMVPHMFGEPADLYPLIKTGVPVIEDCAQALGAKYNGKYVGTCGTLGVYSFYATKMMTTGEGGMVVTSNRRLYEFIRDRHEYDHKEDYCLRFNYKMTDPQAAMGRSQLKHLDAMLAQRRRIARVYESFLGNFNVNLPGKSLLTDPVYYRYIIKAPGKAKKVIALMNRRGVRCAQPLFKPLHQYLGQKGFPAADMLMQDSISLPIYPTLTQKEINHVERDLKDVLQKVV